MELIKDLIEIILHLDKYLDLIIRSYGVWTYALLFLIIFCETGLVITPFLPGDSLLFAAGTFTAIGSLDVGLLIILLSIAAIAGDNVNYWIGYFAGSKAFIEKETRFLNKEYLNRTHRFYEKHGGKTIVIARFLPIIRTFAPFVAGVGRMTYRRFTVYNIAGGVVWVLTFVLGGYFFGNITFIKQNFTVVIIAIIFISFLPGVIEVLHQRYQSS
ncbi:MAG TPA: DedA family protein [Thermodesulfobacteriota bacterium]|nr:DedA family protein [Thermodesulfobacteriota bacterium]